jgi:hypothetical protein
MISVLIACEPHEKGETAGTPSIQSPIVPGKTHIPPAMISKNPTGSLAQILCPQQLLAQIQADSLGISPVPGSIAAVGWMVQRQRIVVVLVVLVAVVANSSGESLVYY